MPMPEQGADTSELWASHEGTLRRALVKLHSSQHGNIHSAAIFSMETCEPCIIAVTALESLRSRSEQDRAERDVAQRDAAMYHECRDQWKQQAESARTQLTQMEAVLQLIADGEETRPGGPERPAHRWKLTRKDLRNLARAALPPTTGGPTDE